MKRKRDILRLTTCPGCGYDLSALPAAHRCPECGFEYDEHTVLIAGSAGQHARHWRDASALLTLIACLFIIAPIFAPLSLTQWMLLLALGAAAVVGGAWRVHRSVRMARQGDVQMLLSREGLRCRAHRGLVAGALGEGTDMMEWGSTPWKRLALASASPHPCRRLRMLLGGRIPSSCRWYLRVHLRRSVLQCAGGQAMLIVRTDVRTIAVLRNELRRRIRRGHDQ